MSRTIGTEQHMIMPRGTDARIEGRTMATPGEKFVEEIKRSPLYTGLKVECVRLRADNAALRHQVEELVTACEAVLAWWGRVYPPDIFDGSSGNENTLEIVRIRNIVCTALGQEEAE